MEFEFIIELEKKLLDPSVRKDSKLVDQLIDDSFVEFGTSGMTYNKKMILERLAEEVPVVIEAFDFAVVKIASDVIQLRFKTRRKNADGSLIASLRSSIWKKTDLNWRMIFHQGTRTNAASESFIS